MKNASTRLKGSITTHVRDSNIVKTKGNSTASRTKFQKTRWCSRCKIMGHIIYKYPRMIQLDKLDK